MLPDLTQAPAELTVVQRHDLLARLKEEGKKLPQVQHEVRHFFEDGLYGRELFLPAGSGLVGKRHLHGCLNAVLGDVSVFSVVDGLRRFTGYETFTSPAGTERGMYAHSDTWWTTVHPNPDNCRDLAVLEQRYIAASPVMGSV